MWNFFTMPFSMFRPGPLSAISFFDPILRSFFAKSMFSFFFIFLIKKRFFDVGVRRLRLPFHKTFLWVSTFQNRVREKVLKNRIFFFLDVGFAIKTFPMVLSKLAIDKQNLPHEDFARKKNVVK